MSRLETFTDAAFAFALTLLAVSLDPPTNWEGLMLALRGVPAFVAGAALLMMFWWGHHQWSRRYELDDGTTVLLTCLLVFTVLVYVYPLRFMAGVLFTWVGMLTGLPLGPSGDLGVRGAADINAMFVIYGLGFTAMCAALVLLHLHAWRKREELRLSALQRLELLGEFRSWAILAVTGLLSVVVAALSPDDAPVLAGFVYMILPVVMPAHAAWHERRTGSAVDP